MYTHKEASNNNNNNNNKMVMMVKRRKRWSRGHQCQSCPRSVVLAVAVIVKVVVRCLEYHYMQSCISICVALEHESLSAQAAGQGCLILCLNIG